MPDRNQPLSPATPEELEQALAHALRFDGRRAFKLSGESMAQITAAHLVGLPRAIRVRGDEEAGGADAWRSAVAENRK